MRESRLPPLRADETLRLPARNGRRRIGLCWHGGIPDPDPRCLPPLALAPLLALPGVEWVGFQLADHAGELPILGLDALGARDFVGHGGRRAAARPRRHGGHGGGAPRGSLGAPTWVLLALNEFTAAAWRPRGIGPRAARRRPSTP